MKKVFVSVLAILLITGVSACSQKKVATVDQAGTASSEQMIQGKTDKSSGPATSTAQVPKESLSERPFGKSQELTDKEMAGKKQQELIKELQSKMQDIHFDFDRYDISSEAKLTLKKIAEGLSNNNKHKIIIEGHCDERGTNEYNLALGDKRANAAKEYLKALGTSAGMLETISYGEEKPVCTESNEECWAKNRRDHFVLAEK